MRLGILLFKASNHCSLEVETEVESEVPYGGGGGGGEGRAWIKMIFLKIK